MNLFQNLPDKLDAEVFEKLFDNDRVLIERIVSLGQSSDEGFWYDQDQTEWVVVLSGEAEVEFEGEADVYHLRPGDCLTIPPHQRHRVAWTTPAEPTIWLAVHVRN